MGSKTNRHRKPLAQPEDAAPPPPKPSRRPSSPRRIASSRPTAASLKDPSPPKPIATSRRTTASPTECSPNLSSSTANRPTASTPSSTPSSPPTNHITEPRTRHRPQNGHRLLASNAHLVHPENRLRPRNLPPGRNRSRSPSPRRPRLPHPLRRQQIPRTRPPLRNHLRTPIQPRPPRSDSTEIPTRPHRRTPRPPRLPRLIHLAPRWTWKMRNRKRKPTSQMHTPGRESMSSNSGLPRNNLYTSLLGQSPQRRWRFADSLPAAGPFRTATVRERANTKWTDHLTAGPTSPIPRLTHRTQTNKVSQTPSKSVRFCADPCTRRPQSQKSIFAIRNPIP